MKRYFGIAAILLVAGIIILAASAGDRLRAYWGSERLNGFPGADSPDLAASMPLDAANDISQSRQNAITKAVERLSPATVGINATETKYYSYSPLANDPFWSLFFQDRVYQQQVPTLGSGFLISEDGLVLSNEHVIGDAKEQDIIITTTDGKNHNIEWVKRDKITDIALMKLKGKGFSFATLGNSDDVIIGEWAIALGNPFGLFAIDNQPSVTVGVISATHRDFGLLEGDRLYKNMIQTDASINPGNSGGPLANSLGDVIGINTFIYTGSRQSQGSVGVGFAIPSNTAREIVDELIRYGTIDRNYETGIEISNVTRHVAYALGLRFPEGVYVSKVERGSSGDKAGIEIGDIILSINDKAVKTANDVKRIIRELDLRAGDYITMEIFRDGKKQKLRVLLAEPRD